MSRIRRMYALYARDSKLTAGHLGTLDPQAAGVLPIALGKATRLIPLLDDRRKAYVCVFVPGVATTTADSLGDITQRSEVPADWTKRLQEVLPQFVGRIQQIPPMHSAVHHEGRRLYEIARQGGSVERKARRVTIYGLTFLGAEAGGARLRISCSEGLYVRTLCEDLAAAIGLPAHMGALVREASGPFVLSESLTLQEISDDPKSAVIAPEHIIPFPTIVLDLRHSADFRAGRAVPLPAGAPARHVFVRDQARMLVGVGETHGALLAPRKVFV